MWKQKSQIVTVIVAIFHVNFTGQSQSSLVLARVRDSYLVLARVREE